tara:strand:+ start:2513 stop:2698 length:186 start_codon:yes stop_codon:yes gene_type:complete
MSEETTYDQITALFEDFTSNHAVFVENGNKAAGTRARKAIGEVKKLATTYRKESVEAAKAG